MTSLNITIKGIQGKNANKDGQPYLDQNGRAKSRITITCDGLPNGKKEMSTFAYQDSPVMKWSVGESHEVDISLSPDGKYVNFFPAKSEMSSPQFTPRAVAVLRAAAKHYEDYPAPVEKVVGEGVSMVEIHRLIVEMKRTQEAIEIAVNKLVKYQTGE